MVRYHSLDALRASMMLLGVVLHSMASYSTAPIGDSWPFRDTHTGAYFLLPMLVIHLFRMPAFFAVAGFFAAFLYARDGAAGFARNRATRVLLPLVIFWATVGPLVLLGFYFAITRGGLMTGDALVAQTRDSFKWSELSPMHLWFLWYLVIFYAVSLAALRVTGRRSVPADLAERLTTRWWSLPLWGGLTTLTLLPMRYPSIDASPLLLPDPRPVIAYGVFFVYGWLLYRARGSLDRLSMWWSWRLLLAMLLVVAGSFGVIRQFSGNSRAAHAAGCVLIGFAIWALVLASLALFIRYVRAESGAMRYLSDASYWTYIVHLPVVIFIAGLLAPWALPSGVKFAIVLSATTAVCLWTYHAFVRSTAIGQLLNGRRHARR